MIAAARLALRYFTTHRFQRWLLVVGLGLLTLGAALGFARTAGAIAVWMVETTAVPMAAFLFRELSMRQTIGLAPHARRRLLASLILFAAVLALTSAVRADGWPYLLADTTTTPFAAAVAVRFSTTTLALLILARWPLVLETWGQGVAFFFGIRWMLEGPAQGGLALPWLMRTGIDVLPLAVAVNVGAWVAFSRWYLTTPSFPARRAPALQRPAGRPSEQLALTPARATALVLDGGITMQWRHAVLGGGAVLAVALWVLARLVPPADIGNMLLTTGGILAFQTGSAAVVEGHRARMLWLSAGSREEIFRVCERRALGRCGAWAAVAVALGAYAWALGLVEPDGAAWGVAFFASLACACSYVGWLFVTGHLARFVLIGVLFASWLLGVALAFTALSAAAGQVSLWLALPVVVLLAEAGVARTIARRRLQQIDWLRQCPLPWLMRGRYGR